MPLGSTSNTATSLCTSNTATSLCTSNTATSLCTSNTATSLCMSNTATSLCTSNTATSLCTSNTATSLVRAILPHRFVRTLLKVSRLRKYEFQSSNFISSFFLGGAMENYYGKGRKLTKGKKLQEFYKREYFFPFYFYVYLLICLILKFLLNSLLWILPLHQSIDFFIKQVVCSVSVIPFL